MLELRVTCWGHWRLLMSVPRLKWFLMLFEQFRAYFFDSPSTVPPIIRLRNINQGPLRLLVIFFYSNLVLGGIWV